MTAKSLDMRTALFPGTFDPFTIGHADILRRGLQIFDQVVICIGVNPAKTSDEDAETRRTAIANLYADDARVKVICWKGLTADAAKQHGAKYLLRGIRSDKDCDYERNLADANREVFGLETVILFADPKLSYISSSLVRELKAYGLDTDRFIPSNEKL